MSLVAFNSCDDALTGLRHAAAASVGPYGLPGQSGVGFAAAEAAPKAMAAGSDARAAAPSALAPDTAAPAYSGTNNHEAGVDEPDIVKTDGHRIITVSRGVLRVVDASTGTVSGRLDISGTDAQYWNSVADILLDGDHALLLVDSSTMTPYGGPMMEGGGIAGGGVAPAAPGSGGATSAPTTAQPLPSPVLGPHLLLVDLAGQPRILASYAIDGGLVDARQIGGTARVVIRSTPRIAFPLEQGNVSDAQRTAANRALIAHVGLTDWLPRFEVTDGGTTHRGLVPCADVRRPAAYTGTNLLTVLTFDMGSDKLGTGQPVTIAADGDTVYATGTSLYIASDQRWRMPVGPMPGIMRGPEAPQGGGTSTPVEEPPTVIYRFDISRPGRPAYVASGSVPGYLVDQYAMSESAGYLRVATTTGTSWAEADGRPPNAVTSESAVYVLSTAGPTMKQVGRVGGLGRGERIYSVRFLGSIGYVVTFRQTDPLYTVDLSDPRRPQVRGEVALTGYSAYLHPASDTRLIGIGQQADSQGHVGGTQVSLFNVADLNAPSRVATFAISNSRSNAEFDPHAFLYWPAMKIVVVPLQTYGMGGSTTPGDTNSLSPGAPSSGVLILRVDDSGITELGFLSQPGESSVGYAGMVGIDRALVIGQTLWTVSANGIMATGLTDLRQIAWIPFT
jgi:Beta propeller domain